MNTRIIKWTLLSIAGLLAAMGLMFTWKCTVDCVYGVDSGVFFFKKQLLWNAVGIAACVGAALIPWRKWLKLAPWGMLAWFALTVWAVGFSPVRHGTQRWADFGAVCVNTHLVLVLAWALFTAWLCSKKCIKPWMIYAAVGVLLIFAAVHIFANPNRLARLTVFFGGEGVSSPYRYVQYQMKAAYAVANWFGDADRSLRYLPVAYANAMPSAAALLFGKWFTLAVAALYAALGGTLAWLWLAFKNPSKRMFILFWGGAMVSSALYSICQSVGVLPVLGLAPALVGYGGALCVIFWAGLGILLSLLSDAQEYEKVPGKKMIVVCGAGCALIMFLILGMAVQGASGLKFHAPPVKTGHLGEFGPQAKRGAIYAADGSVLARSVKRYDVRIDPKVARENRIAFNEDSLTNICSRLELTPRELLNFCNMERSRYGLVRSNVEESVAKWFLSDEGRRLSKGFIIEPLQKRDYPLGSNAVHVVGCVHRWRESGSQGASGIEYTFNKVLAGKDGEIVRNAGRAEQIARATPVHGGSVTTTVVPPMQNILADALVKAVSSNRAETAWGIVMNATNGAIAAMASWPMYDPMKSRDIKDGMDYFRNNAAMMNFEPGGLMKPLTYAMALDKGLVTPDTGIDHGNGVWEYNGTKLYDVPGATGVLSVAKALAMRTEIGSGKVGHMMWKDRDIENILRLGFGRKVGGGTVYGEETGIVWASNRYDAVTLTRLGLGRGLAVTALQVANAYAALANGGKTVAPHLVAKVVSTNGVVSVYKAKEPSERVISDKTSKTITSMMKDAMAAVAKEFSADFGGVDVAGMIAETRIPVKGVYSETDYNTSVAGFFPVDSPEWVLVIGFGRPKTDHCAGRSALPVFADIVRRIGQLVD
ncbi:MAG: FtsW/RodA/SpoVE family cell cycle protein [Kiritimatiellae bacterium]|nr:FtsW/RodA/SpoVE family cell cycle protein [Kiritimatiellia bacterium]